jgi:hypothetical protein
MDRATPQSHPFSAQCVAPRRCREFFCVEHDLFGKPAATLGSSPRAGFSGSCSVRRHIAEIDDVVFLVERVHQPVVSQLLLAQAGELGEELIETRGLENHQAARGAAGRQIERVRHAGRNVHAGARLRRHPVAIEMKIHDAVQDIKGLGVLAVQMQAEREFALEIVFHQRIGAAGVGGGDLDVGVVAKR